LVKDKIGFLSEKVSAPGGSAKGKYSLLPIGPRPGQKSIRLAKGGGSSFLDAGFRRFSPGMPLQPRLLAESKQGELNRFLPALFDFDACFFARGTR